MRHAVAAKAALADIPQADAELELLVLAALVEAEGSLGHDLPAALTTRVVELEATVEPSIHSFNGSGVIAAFFESAAEFDDARRWLVPTLSWAIEHTLTRYPRHLGHLVHVETGAERWAEAERLSGELFEWADQLEQPLIRTWALGLRAQLDARLGRIDLARSTAEEALSGAEASGDEHLLMEAHVALGF